MAHKMLDENKILLVLLGETKTELKRQFNFFYSDVNLFPMNFYGLELEVFLALKNNTTAETCNIILNNSNAKYKIFVTSPIAAFNKSILLTIIKTFFEYPKVAMIGLFGSELPITGDFTQAKNLYGSYSWSDEHGTIQFHEGKTPLFYQSVHTIDSNFFAVAGDIPFDEQIGDDFFLAAQSCRYRQAGYDVGVIYFPKEHVVFSGYNCSYTAKTDDHFQNQLLAFKTLYKDAIQPLVSICIPTYNQPIFFELALQSALSQTYENIEIIVGDDSTNEDTKQIIQPYLATHKNIKYFHHGKPLGKRGGNNTRFIVNQAAGKYINVLFHDDMIFPKKISRMMEYFVQDLENELSLISSTRVLIDDKNDVIRIESPWRCPEDTILTGESVGRTLLFFKNNFLGELSTCLMKKSELLTEDIETGEKIFDVGVFCGVKDLVYGDMGTWLNLLKNGKKCLFISEVLSAFRRHPAQNTYNPDTRIRLYLEFMGYITLAWLNNVFIHNAEEYEFCCRHWKLFLNGEYPTIQVNGSSEEILAVKLALKNMNDFLAEEKYPETLDCSIRFLLTVLPKRNALLPLIRKNADTGLWEKASDGIITLSEQRY